MGIFVDTEGTNSFRLNLSGFFFGYGFDSKYGDGFNFSGLMEGASETMVGVKLIKSSAGEFVSIMETKSLGRTE